MQIGTEITCNIIVAAISISNIEFEGTFLEELCRSVETIHLNYRFYSSLILAEADMIIGGKLVGPRWSN